MLDSQIETTKTQLQAKLARKAELLDALEIAKRDVENLQLVLQVLEFAKNSAEAPEAPPEA